MTISPHRKISKAFSVRIMTISPQRKISKALNIRIINISWQSKTPKASSIRIMNISSHFRIINISSHPRTLMVRIFQTDFSAMLAAMSACGQGKIHEKEILKHIISRKCSRCLPRQGSHTAFCGPESCAGTEEMCWRREWSHGLWWLWHLCKP